jgi:PAS domain S-box-containing protein
MPTDREQELNSPAPADDESRLSLERSLERALELLARKEAELAEARRSEERYRSLVEKVMDLVFCVDLEGKFTFANSAVLSILGYRTEELIGQNFATILTEESRPVAQAHFQRNIQGRGPRTVYDLEMVAKDGRHVPMEIHGTNSYENGVVVGVRGIARDVSDRRRSEQRQRHHINELRTMNRIGQQIASVLDLDELLPFIVEAVQKGSEYHYVNIFLRDDSGEKMVLRATSGDYGFPLPLGTSLKVGEEGVVGWVAQSGKPMLLNDVTKEHRYIATRELQLTRSELIVPVKLGNQIVGVLDIESDKLGAFDDADLQSARTLADQIAVALRNAELFEAERTRREETATILEVTRAVNSTLLLDEVLRVAANSIGKTVGVPDCGMYLLDDTGTKLIPGQSSDTHLIRRLGNKYTDTVLDVAASPFLKEILETKQPVISSRADSDPRTNKNVIDAFGIKSLLAVPFVARDRPLGIAMVTAHEDYYEFQLEHVELAAGIANSVALAIENARLYERTRELAIIEERNRLAREIHDTIAQGLTGIILQLEAADQLIESNLDRARMRVQKATALARSSLQEARRSVWNLRPTPLEDKKLVDAIRQELDRMAEEASWEVSFQLEGEASVLPGETENGLYRIAQEALNNVRKHAQASRVDVRLGLHDGTAILWIRDDGVGFDPTTARSTTDGGGFGLLGLRERARLLGGTLRIESAPGCGTLMEVEIPIT